MVVLDDEGRMLPCEILGEKIQNGESKLDSPELGNLRDFDYDIRRITGTARLAAMREDPRARRPRRFGPCFLKFFRVCRYIDKRHGFYVPWRRCIETRGVLSA